VSRYEPQAFCLSQVNVSAHQFRKEMAFGGIREKLRQAVAHGQRGDRLGWGHTGAHSAQP